jgi:hypothetical protein
MEKTSKKRDRFKKYRARAALVRFRTNGARGAVSDEAFSKVNDVLMLLR